MAYVALGGEASMGPTAWLGSGLIMVATIVAANSQRSQPAH